MGLLEYLHYYLFPISHFIGRFILNYLPFIPFNPFNPFIPGQQTVSAISVYFSKEK